MMLAFYISNNARLYCYKWSRSFSLLTQGPFLCIPLLGEPNDYSSVICGCVKLCTVLMWTSIDDIDSIIILMFPIGALGVTLWSPVWGIEWLTFLLSGLLNSGNTFGVCPILYCFCFVFSFLLGRPSSDLSDTYTDIQLYFPNHRFHVLRIEGHIHLCAISIDVVIHAVLLQGPQTGRWLVTGPMPGGLYTVKALIWTTFFLCICIAVVRCRPLCIWTSHSEPQLLSGFQKLDMVDHVKGSKEETGQQYRRNISLFINGLSNVMLDMDYEY